MKTRANINNFLVMLVFLLATLCTAAAGGVIYVDGDAVGANDGSSWADAYNYLQDTLATASSGDEIWVAEGTYKPDEDTANPGGSGSRTAKFQLINGVAIYGGFAGVESSREQRNWETNETILSGDLNGDDGPDFANNGENSRRVVTGSGTDGTAVLDGFTIMGGYADIWSGAGMYNYGGSPTVTNCTFSGNSAARGGGMCNWNYSSPTLSNCTFSENSGSTGGGMANWDFSSPTLMNCTFGGNSGYSRGGGICNSRSSPTLTNCTFSDNSATGGGGIHNWNSNPTLTNCTFSGNSGQFGGGVHNLGSSPTLTNCTFTGNSAESGAGMYSRGNSNPMLTECEFAENVASDYAGGMDNYDGSPTVTNCTFSRNSARAGGGMANNVNSNTTVTSCTFSGNSARDNGGGMHNFCSSPTVTNCKFRGNSVIYHGGGMDNNVNCNTTVTNCVFSGNSAHIGGGMHNVDSSSMVTNCTFSENSAHFGGGMCNLHNSSPMVTNCTFSENSATMYGGGVYNSYNSSPMVTNSILWGDTSGTGPEIYNDGTSSPTVTYCDVQGGCSGAGNIDADPLFADDDLRLSAGSPCINAGSDAALPPDTADLDGDDDTTEPIPLDLDGNPRIFNGTVDMGAYESEGQGPSIITVEIDIKPGSFPNSINLGSKGVIPVAILTTDDFDAITVMPETVGFGPGDALPVHWALEDVDGDGDLDWIFHFKTQETEISESDTEATLIGRIIDSIPISGTDSVRTVPPKGKKK